MFVRSVVAVSILLGLQGTPSSGDAVIRAMHDRYEKSWYRTLTFNQKTTLRRGDSTVVESWHEESMSPGKLRIEIARATGPVSALYLGDSLYVWRGDSVLVRAQSPNILMTMGFDVYTQPAAQTLAELAKLHYPMRPVREDTWEGRAVYVIGSGRQQLWIDKERLLFVRATEPYARDTTKANDFRFDNYVEVPGGWLSETVATYRDGKLTQYEEYSDIRPNAAVDTSRFAPPAGKAHS